MVWPMPRVFWLKISESGLGVVVCGNNFSTILGRCGTSASGTKEPIPLPSLLSPEVEALVMVLFLVKVEFDPVDVFFLFIIWR